MNTITLPAAFSASENSPADVSRMNKVIVRTKTGPINE